VPVGRMSGVVMIRPVRMSLLLGPEMSALRRAVHWTTSAWGGIYTPLFKATAGAGLLRTAEGLAIDVLHPVDDLGKANPLVQTPGYVWHGGGEWGPYEQPKEHMSARLLGPEWLLDRLPEGAQPFFARWDDDDPLADLFSVWLGTFGPGEYEQSVAAQVERRGVVVEIESGAAVDLPDGISPIMLTSREIEYSGLSSFHGFAVVDPTDPTHLRRLWNTRALGGDVFPWPLVHGERLENMALQWLEKRLSAGELSTWRRGDGTPLPPQASVMMPDDNVTMPTDLERLLAKTGVSSFLDPYDVHGGWNGVHPFGTEFERRFSTDVGSAEWWFSVPIPEFVPSLRRDPIAGSMIVIAHVEIYREHALGSTRWAVIPNVRPLADLLTGASMPSTVRRPVHGGRAMSVEVSAEECSVEILPSIDVVTKLFEGSTWECSQSDNGRFASRLEDILGGAESSTANQPAVREVLVSTVRSPTGKTVRQLRDSAKKNRGSWPGRLSWRQDPDVYAEQVVNLLLYRKLLRPHLSVRCPECAITTTMRPEDLGTSMTCDMCSAEFPLGFALAHGRSNASWHYRLHQDIGEDRLLEALAVIATASALGSPGLFESANLHQFGVQLKTPRQPRQPPGHECELDVLMVVHDRGQPEVIVGEVKNQGSLEEQDLDNLLRVQSWFLGRGIDCYPLFAALRDELRADERDLLRSACERAPRVLGNQVLPLFPIVLLRPDLSTAPLEPDHPRSWRINVGAMTNLPVQSCVRNLGLQAVDWIPAPSGAQWQCRWT
jgi:hypothetical protein